jgi:hypothetical protein
VCCALDVL